MSYNNNIPLATDQLNDSQVDLLNNFIAIQDLIVQNHVGFNVPNRGKHNIVTMPENLAPTPTLIDEASIYSSPSPFTGQTELQWQRENSGTRIEWSSMNVEPLDPKNGWSLFPSGILVKWGTGTITAGNGAPIVITYPVNINGIVAPVFGIGNVYCVFTTGISGAVGNVDNVQIDSGLPLGNLTFTARGFTNGAVPFNFYYVAIGKR